MHFLKSLFPTKQTHGMMLPHERSHTGLHYTYTANWPHSPAQIAAN